MRPEYWCLFWPVVVSIALSIGSGIIHDLYNTPKLRARCLRVGEVLLFVVVGMWIMWFAFAIYYGERIFK